MHDDTADPNSKITASNSEDNQGDSSKNSNQLEDNTGDSKQSDSEDLAASQTQTAAKDEKSLKHVYYEVGNDLLSKPNALIDIIQAQGESPVVVFCNSPSEADFVDVMLKKHGLNCAKLIGHVPPMRISQAVTQVKEKSLDALVVTDVAARDLEVKAFELLINYSIHDDPEVYIHRIAPEAGIGNLKTIASIISPLDFGNFHYLKKLLDYDFEKVELPTEEMVFVAQAKRLLARSSEGPHLSNARVKQIVPILLADERREDVVALLCYNTLDLLPGLMAGAEREENKEYYGDKGRDRDRDREGDRRGRNYGRGNRRGDSSYRDKDSNYGDTDRSSSYRERKQLPPRKKDQRIYIGHGSDNNFSEEEFVKIVEQHCQDVGEEQIKRFSIRSCYSYVDIPEEIAASALEELKGVKRNNGEVLFLRKATMITSSREESEGQSLEQKNEEEASSSPEAEPTVVEDEEITPPSEPEDTSDAKVTEEI